MADLEEAFASDDKGSCAQEVGQSNDNQREATTTRLECYHEKEPSSRAAETNVTLDESDTSPTQLEASRTSDVVSNPAELSAIGHPASSQGSFSSSSSIGGDSQSFKITAGAFLKLGIAFLILQTLSLIGFSWYAWHIENGAVELPTTFTLHCWFVFGVWIIALPYRENFFLSPIAGLLMLLSTNPLFIYVQNSQEYYGTEASAHVTTIVFHILPCLLAMFPICAAREIHKIARGQKNLNEIALASLETTLKAGLPMVYLVSAAIAGLGGQSYQEILDAMELMETEEDQSSQQLSASTQDSFYLENRLAAAETVDNYQEFRKASMAGLSLNMLLIQAFIMVHIARLSFSDVVAFRITVVEEISITAMLAMIVFVLVDLAVTKGGDYTSAWFWLFGAIMFVSWFLMTYTVFRGNHPYFDERTNRRTDGLNHEQQRLDEIIPFTDP